MDQYRRCLNQKFKHANKSRCLSFISGRVQMMMKMCSCGVWSFGMAPAWGWLITGASSHHHSFNMIIYNFNYQICFHFPI